MGWVGERIRKNVINRDGEHNLKQIKSNSNWENGRIEGECLKIPFYLTF